MQKYERHIFPSYVIIDLADLRENVRIDNMLGLDRDL
jgi:hypothetical protein